MTDTNDRSLTVDDYFDHGFRSGYNGDVTDFRFNGQYHNQQGWDNIYDTRAINNAGQVIGKVLHNEFIDQWGFPSWGGNVPANTKFNELTLWTNGVAESITREEFKEVDALNDDGVVIGRARGLNEFEQQVSFLTLWIKSGSQWKEKTLLQAEPGDVRKINRNIQIICGNTLIQNGHAIDIYTRIPTGYANLKLLGINEAGFMVGQADTPNGPGRVILLAPAELMVDANRDGKIDDADRGQVTEENPYRFWVNDDDDNGDIGGSGIPNFTGNGVGVGNGVDGEVNGTKDLIDFFPLALDIGWLVEVFPVNDFEYVIENEDHHLNFVFTDLDPSDSRAYLTQSNSFKNATVNHVSTGGVSLAEGFLQRIRDNGVGILLFEAGAEVTRPIELVIRQKTGGQEAGRLSLPVNIDSVQKMYRHYNVMFADGVFGGRPTELQEPLNYPDKLCNAKSLVFVHGYNVNAQAARGWNAEMFKSMWWSGSRAKFYGVTWHGSESQIGSVTANYHVNVDNAFATAQPFAGFINHLSNATVIAHSLGNLVVSSAIHDWGGPTHAIS